MIEGLRFFLPEELGEAPPLTREQVLDYVDELVEQRDYDNAQKLFGQWLLREETDIEEIM